MSRDEQQHGPERLIEHVQFVRGLARSILRDEHLAEDIVQETLLMALRRPPRPWNLRGWLGVVTRNFALRRRREEQRRRRREQAVAREEAMPASAHIVGRLEIHRAVVDAVLELPEHYRAVIVYRYFDGLGRGQIAKRLGVPQETVKTRLRRALTLLRARLDEIEGGHSMWMFALLPLLRADSLARTAAAKAASLAKLLAMPTLVRAATLGAVLLAGAWLLWTARGSPPVDREGLRRASRTEALARAPQGDATVPAQESPLPVDPLSVQGFVHNGIGEPIAGALVVAPDLDRPFAARTDAAGRFGLEAADSGVLAVVVEAEGYSAWRGSLDPLEDGEHSILLVRGSSLTVRLLTPTRTPVAGACAEAFVVERRGVAGLYSSSRIERLGRGVSDSGGVVRLGRAPEGHVEIRVCDPRFACTTSRFDVVGPDPVEHEIILTRGGVIAGHVFDPGGRGVEGARVYVSRAARCEARTDRDGAFRLEAVPVGESEILAEAAALGAGYFGSTLGWGEPIPVHVAPGQLVTGIDIELAPASFVAGRLVDDLGRPVEEASVRSIAAPPFGSSPRTSTDEGGRFRIGPLPGTNGASVSLSFAKAGFASGSLHVVPEGGTQDLGDVRIPRLGAVRGRVRSTDGQPVRCGRVRVSPGGQGAFVAPDGTFAIQGIAPGPVHLTAEAPRPPRRSGPTPLLVEPGGKHTLEITLDPVAAIRGRAVSPTGEAREGVLIGALPIVAGLPRADFCLRVRTGADGAFSLEGLAEGAYLVGLARLPHEHIATPGSQVPLTAGPASIRLVLPGMQVDAPSSPLLHDPDPVRVHAGRDDVTLCVPSCGVRVRGRVVSRGREAPLTTFDVSFIRFERFIPRQVVSTAVRDNPRGAFACDLPDTGLWVAEIRAPGHATSRTAPFPSAAGEACDLGTVMVGPGGRLRGSVMDLHGAPVGYARIHLMSACLQDSDRPIFTDADGRYEAAGLAAGRYSLFALSPRHPLGLVEDVVIRDQATTQVDIRLHAAYPVTLVVVDEQDQPVAGAEVVYAAAAVWPLNSRLLRSFEPPGWGGWLTDEEGVLRKPCMPATRVSFLVRADGFAPTRKVVDLDAAPPGRIEIRLSRR